VKIGFNHFSGEIRSISSSIEPRQQISNLMQKSIEHQRSIETDDSFDSSNEINDFREYSEHEEIEDFNPMYEDPFSKRGREYEDDKL